MEKCYNCGKKGHYARDYWYKKAEGNVATSSQNQKDEEEIWDFETSYAVEETNHQEELVTYHSNKEEEIAFTTVSEKLVDYEHDWIVNSGCFNHMTGDEKNLINISEYKGGQVVVTANNSKMPITHIGKTVFVPHHNSRQVELPNVYHVPELLQESVQEALQPQLRRKTRLKCSNAKYIDATLAEVVNNKDTTIFEEASKSRD
ncbi:hypothetical protein KY284_030131 [Solanum tuberosum]|nr:hypothetical protein KY284_030131 [Solanum tuberosum]